LAPAKAAIAAIRRAIEGVIGLGSIGSVPIGLPALVFGAICALLLGRLLLGAARRRSLGPPSADPASSGSDSPMLKVVRMAANMRRH
jgi:hypothetical protein